MALRRLGREMSGTFADIVWDGDPSALSLGIGTLSLVIGVFLAQNFTVLGDSVSYRFMAQQPEWFWAGVFVVVGVSKIVVCLANTALLRCSWFKFLPFALNVVIALLWLLIWAGIYLSNPNTLGTPIYLFMTLAPSWCALRRLRQALALR